MSNLPSLYVIGLGPGDTALLSPQALQALENSEVIVGYGLYVDMVPHAVRVQKELITTGMRHEQERCYAAIAKAKAGQRTSIVCSGDAGIYGMSGLILELLAKENLLEQLHVEIIPGIPAVCGAAALLGAPLMHDFACVSLSDLLTPWPRIIQRVHAALSADFVLALYNPRSRGRQQHLEEVLAIVKEYRQATCPMGLVRNAYRPEQEVRIFTVQDFPCTVVDMLSLVLIGNSQTKQLGQYMVTPRGYTV